MEDGCADSAGSNRPKAASTKIRSSSKKGERFIVAGKTCAASARAGSRFALPLRVERLRGKLSVSFLQKDFHAPYRFFELLLAFARKRHTFLEQLHRVIQGQLWALTPTHDFSDP